MPRFAMRSFTLIASAAVLGTLTVGTGAAHAEVEKQPLLKGKTTASYYWDDASGRNGDTGLPASGKPMQKGLVASPSWPLLTEGYVMYKGKKEPFFVGDRGPGVPSNNGVMLDLDAKTFAALTGGKFNRNTLSVDGIGGEGHIKVEYVITKWGNGVGKKNHPVAFSTGAWSRKDKNPAKPPVIVTAEDKKVEKKTPAVPVEPVKAPVPSAPAVEKKSTELAAASTSRDAESGGAGGLAVAGGLVLLGGGLFLGRDRLRKVFER